MCDVISYSLYGSHSSAFIHPYGASSLQERALFTHLLYTLSQYSRQGTMESVRDSLATTPHSPPTTGLQPSLPVTSNPTMQLELEPRNEGLPKGAQLLPSPSCRGSSTVVVPSNSHCTVCTSTMRYVLFNHYSSHFIVEICPVVPAIPLPGNASVAALHACFYLLAFTTRNADETTPCMYT